MKVTDEQKMERYKAMNILRLVKWHKKTCHIADCGISTYHLLEDFQRHMGREATQKEFGYFM